MVIDYWAHAHFDDPKLRNELVVAEGFSDDLAEMEAEALAKEAEHEAKVANTPEGDWEDV